MINVTRKTLVEWDNFKSIRSHKGECEEVQLCSIWVSLDELNLFQPDQTCTVMLTAGKVLKRCLPRKSPRSLPPALQTTRERRCATITLRKTIPRLIITDQPGFAADIARLLRLKNVGENLEQGYFGDSDSQRDVVAWCYGNTFSIVDPVSEPKQWRLSQLPFFPPLEDVPPSGPAASEHLQVLAELIASADMVICAMEPTSSGQLLFHDILSHVRSKLNVNVPDSKLFRVWLHDRSREAIRLALKEPLSNELFKHFSKSARLRRFVDWSAQYNYSKLYTLLYSRHSSQIFQLNRLQLVLLRKVTERYLERREFQPKPFFEIQLDCLVQGKSVIFKWTKDTSNLVPYDSPSDTDDFTTMPEAEATTIEKPRQIFKKGSRHHSTDSKEEAHQIAHSLEPTSIIVGHKIEAVHQPPPLLYNLTSIQREAYERYSIPASATHVALQALYEKHCLISNPSTASHQLPLYKTAEIEETLKYFTSLRKYSAATKGADWRRLTSRDPRVFDSLLASHDCHAIIPVISNISAVRKREAGMTNAMLILYDMIIRRFLSAMMPDMVHSTVTVMLENADKYYFEAKAAVLKFEGWKSVGSLPKAQAPFNPGPSNFPTGYIPSSMGEDEETTQEELIEQKYLFKALSALRLGDELKGFVPAAVVTKEPSPPPLYTQSKVLAILEEKSMLIHNDLVSALPSHPDLLRRQAEETSQISPIGHGSSNSKSKTLKQENGLGRPEERADLLTKLISAKWLRTRQDRYLEPTRKGILLTKLIQDDSIVDLSHSQSWDNTLGLIAKGKGSSSSAFLHRVKSVIQPDVLKYIPSSSPPSSSQAVLPPVHLDDSTTRMTGGARAGVSENTDPEALTAMAVPSSAGSVEVAYDLIYYHTNTASAKALNEAPALSTTRCPKCHTKGYLKQGPTAYFCASPRCNFTIPQIISQKLLTIEEAKTLIQSKQPSHFSGLIDPAGNTFDATVFLQPPYYKVEMKDVVITTVAEPKSVDTGSKTLSTRRSRDDMLGSSRIVSGLSGPGRPMRGTALKKTKVPKGKPGRPALPEAILAERIRIKVDHQLTKSMAKQAKEEKLKQQRDNPIAAPAVRIDAEGNERMRRGRPRVGEYVPREPKHLSVGRPRLSDEEVKRRAALKRRPGRPSLAEVLRRRALMQKEQEQLGLTDTELAKKKLGKKIAKTKSSL